MSVLIQTSAGNIVVDLFVDEAPIACENFTRHCASGYYDGVLFYEISPDWILTGDPTGTGRGGESAFASLPGLTDVERKNNVYFKDELNGNPNEDISPIPLNQIGLVCMANDGPNRNGSRFFFTLNAHGVAHLDGKKTVFGYIAEDENDQVLTTIANLNVDEMGRPFRDVRIVCTHVLIDAFNVVDFYKKDDKEILGLSARPNIEEVEPRIAFDEYIDDSVGKSEQDITEKSKQRESKARTVALEIMGDLPSADVKPPENVLFVCKLNPATQDEDLEIIFSRFGEINECQVIRDKESGESLQYAFIEFAADEQCQEAFFKMDNAVIDDRRIKVDFSQSVYKLWNRYNCQRNKQNVVCHMGDSRNNQNQGVKNRQYRPLNRCDSDSTCRKRNNKTSYHSHDKKHRYHENEHKYQSHRLDIVHKPWKIGEDDETHRSDWNVSRYLRDDKSRYQNNRDGNMRFESRKEFERYYYKRSNLASDNLRQAESDKQRGKGIDSFDKRSKNKLYSDEYYSESDSFRSNSPEASKSKRQREGGKSHGRSHSKKGKHKKKKERRL